MFWRAAARTRIDRPVASRDSGREHRAEIGQGRRTHEICQPLLIYVYKMHA